MLGRLLLLSDQCEPLGEFITIMENTNYEIENPRATEYLGRGMLNLEILHHHQFVLEELLYPILDKCNPSRLYVDLDAHYVTVTVI